MSGADLLAVHKVCTPVSAYCKRGHLKTEATTFVRKVMRYGRLYICRGCRQCHSMRNTPEPKTGRRNKSKWLAGA